MKKLLSIIIPSYNMEAYLPRCIDSLGLSSSSELEFEKGIANLHSSTSTSNFDSSLLDVIIVNDGSKDRTSEIAHGFAKKYPSTIRVIDKPNGHYGSCINAALKVATGTFVKILEPDDGYNTPDFHAFIAELQRGVESGSLSDIDLIITDYAFSNLEGKITKSVTFSYPPRQRLSFDEFQQPLTYHIQLPAVTYRTDLFKQMDYHQTEGVPYTDLEWLTYPMRLVRNATYLPYSIYRYYIGRADQSVNPESFKKGIGTIARLMNRMLGDYATLVDPSRPSVEAYVQKVILTQLGIVYNSYLLERNPYLTREDILSLDDAVRAVPSLYAKSAEATLHSNHFDFHYVCEFRRARSRWTMKFVAQRIYSGVAKWKCRGCK